MSKIVFVTGGSRGIGRAIVKNLLDKDYKVIVGYKKEKKLADELVEENKSCFSVQVDISSLDSIKDSIDFIKDVIYHIIIFFNS